MLYNTGGVYISRLEDITVGATVSGIIGNASIVRRSWRNTDVIEQLAELMLLHGTPEYLRSDNGPEFTAKKVRKWLDNAGVISSLEAPGRTVIARVLMLECAMNFWTGSCSAICMRRRFWQSAGWNITIPSGRIRRSVVGHLHRRVLYPYPLLDSGVY